VVIVFIVLILLDLVLSLVLREHLAHILSFANTLNDLPCLLFLTALDQLGGGGWAEEEDQDGLQG
jgi:hypothetical protein